MLKFDAINDNLPEIVEYYGSNSRKVTCEWYIDDRSLLPNDVEIDILYCGICHSDLHSIHNDWGGNYLSYCSRT